LPEISSFDLASATASQAMVATSFSTRSGIELTKDFQFANN
jgi:hypothetical protein